MTLISLENVEKTFVVRTKMGRLRRARTVVRVVDDVSFSVAAGSTLGYSDRTAPGKVRRSRC